MAVGCGLFGSGSGMHDRPGQVPGVVAGCGMWSSAPCVFPVALIFSKKLRVLIRVMKIIKNYVLNYVLKYVFYNT